MQSRAANETSKDFSAQNRCINMTVKSPVLLRKVEHLMQQKNIAHLPTSYKCVKSKQWTYGTEDKCAALF